MSGLFSIFNIAKNGIRTHQTGLQVIAHNVANADTDGYSVQRANIRTTTPFGIPSLNSYCGPGQLGTGSIVSSIDRARDQFIDTQIRKETSTLGKYDARQQSLSEVEAVFNEPSDTGLSSVLDKFWSSWQQLSTNPEPNSTARTLVVQNAESLATAINHNYDQLTNIETNAADMTNQQVSEVNNILKQISDLNKQIKAVKIGGENPNDLLDRRDLLLDQLSERFGFEVDKGNLESISINAKTSDGSTVNVLSGTDVTNGLSFIKDVKNVSGNWQVTVYVDGNVNNEKTIDIDEATAKSIANIDAGNNVTSLKTHIIFYNNDGGTDNIKAAIFESGSLNGNETISSEVMKYKDQLNNLAKVLAISVNTIHSGSVDPDDTDTVNFFDKEAETADEPAKVISVNQEIIDDPKKINAGNYLNGDPNFSEGNGERALLMGQLQSAGLDILNIKSREDFINKSDANVTPDNLKIGGTPNGITIDNYFKSTIAELGVSSQEAQRMVTNQNVLLSQLKTKQQSVSGVSIDEEITNMIQFQRAYEANAKMVSVIDGLLDVVINGLIK